MVDGQSSTYPLNSNILDKSSYQIALMRDLKNGEIPTSYRIFDGKKNRNYYFKYLGVENIDTPLGNFETIKLSRHRSQQDGQSLLLWCAKVLDYLPIRVDSYKGDELMVTAIIKQFRQSGGEALTIENSQ